MEFIVIATTYEYLYLYLPTEKSIQLGYFTYSLRYGTQYPTSFPL